jgi:hypothetical protein
MRKSDIRSMGDIARLILENAAGAGGVSSNSSALYDKLGQNLRENEFNNNGKGIVMFYTMKPSDDENDKLHNAAGPAVIFADSSGNYNPDDEENTFYFINGERVDPASKTYTAAASKASGSAMTQAGDIDTDTLGTAEEYGF